MRFNVGEKITPKDGEVRMFCKFLWWPRRIRNEIVWLEYVHITQQYLLPCGGAAGYGAGSGHWETVRCL